MSRWRAIAEPRAAAKAEFCLHTGIAPSEYEQLTLLERNAFLAEHAKIQKSKNQ